MPKKAMLEMTGPAWTKAMWDRNQNEEENLERWSEKAGWIYPMPRANFCTEWNTHSLGLLMLISRNNEKQSFVFRGYINPEYNVLGVNHREQRLPLCHAYKDPGGIQLDPV